MLYTMVAASLIHILDNFEQNVELLEKSNKRVIDSLVALTSIIDPGGDKTDNKDKECLDMSHCKPCCF